MAVSSDNGPLWFCDRLSISYLTYLYVVLVLFFFLRLRFVRRLSPSVVFLSAFAMGSPWPGSSVGFLHSIGTMA